MSFFRSVDYARFFKIAGFVLVCAVAIVLLLVFFSGQPQADKVDAYKAMQERGVLRVGVSSDSEKLGSYNEAGELVGLEVDLSRLLARELLGNENSAMLTPVDARTRTAAIASGNLDLLIARFTQTETRKKSYAFSAGSYFTDGLGIMTKGGEDVPFSSLAGKKVATVYAAVAGDALVAQCDEQQVALTKMEYGSYPEAMDALDRGEVDAFCEETLVLFRYKREGFTVSSVRFAPQAYRVACRIADSALMEHVDAAMAKLEASGELAGLRRKWGVN